MKNDLDDMDELFREAAENYPLNTNSANWNKIMQQLHPAATDLPGKQTKDYRYLWLLLLLPIGFICTRYNNYNINSEETIFKEKTNYKQSKNIKQSVAIKQSNEKDVKNTVIKKEDFNSGINIKKQAISFVKPNRNFRVHPNQNTTSLSEVIKKSSDENKLRIDKLHKSENNTGIINILSPVTSQQKNLISPVTDNIFKPASPDANKSIPVTLINDSIIQPSLRNSEKSRTKHSKKFFYAGIIFGPDFSIIKKQKIEHSGSTIGIIAGYQLNKKLTLETGGWWDKKNYYSKGEYFNTNKIPLPYNVKIITVNGSCNMIELPLNVRYNIFQNKKGEWFVSAGVSSYFMKKEDYTYLYDHNNVQYNVSMSYKNSSKDIFSVINISAGYQLQIGNAMIRIEPYLKIPLKGVGIGMLPITSTGLHLSISHPLHK